MNRFAKAAVLTRLRDELDSRGSWCGETHLQKATLFLQVVGGVPLEFDFVLHKHGPFSFELRNELNALRADGLLVLEPQPYPYGPRLATTSLGERIQTRFPKTLETYSGAITRVADFIRNRGVASLERLGTALYLIEERTLEDDSALAAELRRVKPHVSEANAMKAIEEVRGLL
jgi:hypothetical protein